MVSTKKRGLKTRNHNTMSEAGFWGWIRSALRKRSQVWKPLQEAKKLVRREYKGENKRQKYEYQCNNCKQWFADKEINVDHKKEVGSLKSGKDLESFVNNLFCEIEGFQILCKNCHNKKTFKK